MAAGMPVLASVAMATGGIVDLGDASEKFAGTLVVQLTGTWTGTITFQASIDGSTYISVLATPIDSSTAVTSPASGATGIWTIDATNLQKIRVNCTAGGTGTVNIFRSQRIG